MTEDEIVGWHQGLDGHKFEQAPGAGDGHGSLASFRPRGHKESDTTCKEPTTIYLLFFIGPSFLSAKGNTEFSFCGIIALLS